MPPQGYLAKMRELATEHNLLMMLDEIQTGLGRTGRLFAYEHEGAKPDVLILGKALGGGVYPVSAVLASEEVLGVFNPGDSGSTFGGNPLGAAVAQAALEVILEEDLPGRAEQLGNYFLEGLKALNSPYVREIRGRGLLIGVEIRPNTARPAPSASGSWPRDSSARKPTNRPSVSPLLW